MRLLSEMHRNIHMIHQSPLIFFPNVIYEHVLCVSKTEPWKITTRKKKNIIRKNAEKPVGGTIIG